MKIEIYCIEKNDDGIITKVGILNRKDNTFTKETKSDLIKRVRKLQKDGTIVDIVTSKDSKSVTIVSDKYLRTDGDTNKENDLLDLKDCDIKK